MVMYGDGENGGGSVYERSGPRQVIISAESSLNPKLYPHTKKLIRTDRKPLFVRPLVLSAAREGVGKGSKASGRRGRSLVLIALKNPLSPRGRLFCWRGRVPH